MALNVVGFITLLFAHVWFARALRRRTRKGYSPDTSGSRVLGVAMGMSLGASALLLAFVIQKKPILSYGKTWFLGLYFLLWTIASVGAVFVRRGTRLGGGQRE